MVKEHLNFKVLQNYFVCVTEANSLVSREGTLIVLCEYLVTHITCLRIWYPFLLIISAKCGKFDVIGYFLE